LHLSLLSWYIFLAPFKINNETPLIRTISQSTGSRVKSFRDTVRARDRGCVISGRKAAGAHVNYWGGFEAAHIFPLAYESYWNDNDYRRWITILPENGGAINSVQNGMLLRNDIHQLFDSYDLSIDPDVCLPFPLITNIVANCYFRIAIRLSSSHLIRLVLPGSILTKSLSMILNGLLISLCDGTSGRLS
jgi:hypothetical protein